MAEEISFIHDHAVFFDEILNCIPASLYLQPTEEDNQRWKKAFKNNKNAEKIKELKEVAQKKRKEKFNPLNDLSMVEQIEGRKKEMEKEEQDEISTVVPLAPVNPARSLDELRQRLRDKIEFLKQNRIEKETKKQSKKRDAPKEKKQSLPEEKRVKVESPVKEEVSEPVESAPTPSVSDVISNIQFGKIRGTEEVDTSLRPKVKKDIHQLLKKAQKKQEYIKKLESTESGKKEAENLKWDSALSKADGVRKKDDPALLQKTIKRQEAKKKKSQEEWKQRKRLEKQKNRPGFEGKRKEFLKGKNKNNNNKEDKKS